jgi:tryptophan synthase beta chain
MVRDFNAVVGREARAQMLADYGRLPDALTACVGGGSNAIGLFHAFLNDAGVRIVGAEAAGEGIETGRHAARCRAGRPGVLHGNRTYLMCDDDGQIIETHSVSAGLDYPGVGPEHAFLKDSGRAEVRRHHRRRGAGRVPSARAHRGHPRRAGVQHAVAQAIKLARELPKDQLVLCNLSGSRRQGRQHHRAREGITLCRREQ